MYTQYGIIIRCVRKDQTAAVSNPQNLCIIPPYYQPPRTSVLYITNPQNLTLHYLTDGSCMLQFSRNREMYYVPVVFVLKVGDSPSCQYDVITIYTGAVEYNRCAYLQRAHERQQRQHLSERVRKTFSVATIIVILILPHTQMCCRHAALCTG